MINRKYKAFILVFGSLFFSTCQFPLGPGSPVVPHKENNVYIKGVVVHADDTLDGISVGVFPCSYNFSQVVSGAENVSRSASALGVSTNKYFLLTLPVPTFETQYFILSGLGMHNADEDLVQELSIDITGEKPHFLSPVTFVLNSSHNPLDTLRFVVRLVEKVYLYKPGSGAIWQSGDTLVLHPTATNPIMIRWYYPRMRVEPPNHTRFMFVLWSLEEGLIWWYPRTTGELQNQPPAFTAISFPQDSASASLLVEGKSYRITVCAVENIDDPHNLSVVTTEILFDGKFRYGMER